MMYKRIFFKAVAVAFVAMTASAAVIIDTGEPVGGGQGNLNAPCGQTFTTGSLGGETGLSTISIWGPATGATADAITLEIYEDADGDFETWGLGSTLLGTSDTQTFTADANTFTFSDPPVLSDNTVYVIVITDGNGNAIAGRWGFTNDGDALSDGALFSGAAQPFGGAYDSAMQITTIAVAPSIKVDLIILQK